MMSAGENKRCRVEGTKYEIGKRARGRKTEGKRGEGKRREMRAEEGKNRQEEG